MSQRILTNAMTLLIALIMAVLVWFAAVRQEDPIIIDLYQRNIPLTIIGPGEDIVLVDDNQVPSQIQVRLRAPQSSWRNLSLNEIDAQLDISTLLPGSQTVPVSVTFTDPRIEVEEIFPAKVAIQLEPLASKTLPIIIRLTGNAPSGLVYRITNEPITATITGALNNIQNVDRVEASIFLNGTREPVERLIQPIARNSLSEIVSDVDVEPSQEIVSVVAEPRIGFSSVGVKANIVGEPSAGYFISSISTDPNEIILRGPNDAPSWIDTGEVSIENTTDDVVNRVPLILPPGFSIETDEDANQEQSRSVLVTVEISAFTGGLSVQRGIVAQGVNQDLNYVINPNEVEILVRGPIPLLQNLGESDITVLIDLFSLDAGVHRLEPSIITSDQLTVGSIIPDIIEVTLTEKSTEITPTTAITSTLVSTATDTITATAVPEN